MTDPAQIKGALNRLQPGTKVDVVLDDGTLVEGTFEAFDGEEVRLEEKPAVQLGDVETVLMEVSSPEGPE